MKRGEISALITAPPRLFFVETPGAVAVDLGCAYTLSIGDDGAGLLEVTAGVVALEWNGRSVEVPAQARCAIRPGAGPGAPWAITAPDLLVSELAHLERGQADEGTLPALLLAARTRDTITLWHLLDSPVLGPEDRARVFDRLAALAPPPAGVEREAIVAGDARALRAYRRALEGSW
jgi:hypothetical protein